MSNSKTEEVLQKQLEVYIASFKLNDKMIDVLECVKAAGDVPPGEFGHDRRPTSTLRALEMRGLIFPTAVDAYRLSLTGERIIISVALLDALTHFMEVDDE